MSQERDCRPGETGTADGTSGQQSSDDSEHDTRLRHFDPVVGLHRRQAANRRLPPIAPCRSRPVLSPASYADAAAHLLAGGMTPGIDLDALRELWRNGGHDRMLAVEVLERAAVLGRSAGEW